MGLNVARFHDFEEGLFVLLGFVHGRVCDLQVVVQGLYEEVGLRLGVLQVDVAVFLERRFVRGKALLGLGQNVLNRIYLLGHLYLPKSSFVLAPRLPILLGIIQGGVQSVNGAIDPVLVDLLREHEVSDHGKLEEAHGLVVLVVLVVQPEQTEQVGDLNRQRRLVEHALRHFLLDLSEGGDLVDDVGLALQVVIGSVGVELLRRY